MAGPILVGKLGWEDVCSLRIWIRPKRLRKRGEGRFRAAVSCPPFASRHEVSFDAHAFVRDVAYLDWRYAQSPREYLRVDGDEGWAVVSHAVWHGYSSAVICDAVGRGLPSLLRRCVAAVDADLAVAMVNPGEERRVSRGGLRPDAAADPLHRQAAHRRRAGAAEGAQGVAVLAR